MRPGGANADDGLSSADRPPAEHEEARMGELWQMDATDLAAVIRRREVSSREVVDAHLDRIDAVNPQVRALTRVLRGEAREAADAADDAQARGDELGPLHGVPVTIKENIDVAGTPTTQGLAVLADAIATSDAPLVSHLRAAGAIVIGRSNMPDLALRWHTDSSVFGATRNPRDPAVTPGGSSGGEAVALATGMTPLGVGNDLGGSLRWPSQCNGTAALKPTTGRIPQATTVEPLDSPLAIQLFNAQGPMARRVRDLRVPFAVMAQPSSRDPFYVPGPAASEDQPAPTRVALVADPAGLGTAPELVDDVRRAADALADAGYAIDEVEPPRIEEALELWQALLVHDVRQLWPFLSAIVGPEAREQFDHILAVRPVMDTAEAAAAWMTRQSIARSWGEFLADHPLVLGPIVTADPFDAAWEAVPENMVALLPAFRFVVPVNLLGLPSVAVPLERGARASAVQVVGRWFHEDECLRAGEVVEASHPVATPIEPVTASLAAAR
jgi:amidase